MFSWPLPPKVMIRGTLRDRYVSSTFGPRTLTVDGKTITQAQHGAIDIPVDVGTPIMAIGGGTVKYIQMNHPKAGTYVNVDHGNGYWSRYLHLSGVSVKVGDRLKAGSTVGLSGGAPGAYGSGLSTGPHLHLEIWKGEPYRGGTLIDPLSIITREAAKVGIGLLGLLAIGGGIYFARKKGLLRPIGQRFPRLRRLTG